MDPEQFLGNLVEVTIDRPIGSTHPKHKNIIYQVNYGFIPGTTSGDGEELDVYVLGVETPLATFKGLCIAIIRRDSENDDKLVVVPQELTLTDNEIYHAVDFQEKFFKSKLVRY